MSKIEKNTQPFTQEEVETNYDAWWDSLTEEQKQQLYNDQEELFKLTIEEIDHKGPNSNYGV